LSQAFDRSSKNAHHSVITTHLRMKFRTNVSHPSCFTQLVLNIHDLIRKHLFCYQTRSLAIAKNHATAVWVSLGQM